VSLIVLTLTAARAVLAGFLLISTHQVSGAAASITVAGAAVSAALADVAAAKTKVAPGPGP